MTITHTCILEMKVNVVPKFTWEKRKLSKILYVDEPLIIREFDVVIKEDKVKKVILKKCKHPNADPESGEFCLPPDLPDSTYDKNTHRKIVNALETYNLDNCYYDPYQNYEAQGD